MFTRILEQRRRQPGTPNGNWPNQINVCDMELLQSGYRFTNQFPVIPRPRCGKDNAVRMNSGDVIHYEVVDIVAVPPTFNSNTDEWRATGGSELRQLCCWPDAVCETGVQVCRM